ncbi:MAG: recombinase family protein [Isosphaeraceae bacterium]
MSWPFCCRFCLAFNRRLTGHCPYQMVLVDELRRHGVEVVFLNGDLDESPEGRLLLQVQGIIAEYERTKIRERCRRGRLFAARSGRVSVLNKAPAGRNSSAQGEALSVDLIDDSIRHW